MMSYSIYSIMNNCWQYQYPSKHSKYHENILFAQIVLNLLWKHEKAKTNYVCLNVILVMCFFYVNTIPHRLVVHVYFYVYLNVVHEGFESVILLVLQIILVRLNSISSVFVVSRCKGSSYFRARSPLVRMGKGTIQVRMGRSRLEGNTGDSSGSESSRSRSRLVAIT